MKRDSKGRFVKGISGNPGGRSKDDKSWSTIFRDIGNMTTEEILEFIPKNNDLGRMIAKLPKSVQMKYLVGTRVMSALMFEPTSGLLNAVMDRAEGKVGEPFDNTSQKEKQIISIPADKIAHDFSDVYRDILARNNHEYAFDGGRGSTKSSFIALVSIALLVNNPEWHMLALRQFSNTLHKSVFSQLKWAINELGLNDSFKSTLSPLEITYLPTGQKIFFSGAGDPTNLKSIKPEFGYIAILWFEEFDQFRGQAEIRNIVQSALRGGDISYRFESWNTPRSKNHWCNKYLAVPKPGRYHLRTNYTTVPKEWLGEVFLNEAEYLKEVNPDAYTHEYLGEATGIGGMVFENVIIRPITDEEIYGKKNNIGLLEGGFDRIHEGLDWGYYPDPFSWGRMHYDAAQMTLYIFDEYRAYKKGNEATYKELLEKKNIGKTLIIADSAEPKSVADYRNYGANIRGAEKGPDSVEYSMKWLQRLKAIVIDDKRAPYHAEEFLNYELEMDKDGEYISAYPDKNNHAIDDVRYGTNLEWRTPGK